MFKAVFSLPSLSPSSPRRMPPSRYDLISAILNRFFFFKVFFPSIGFFYVFSSLKKGRRACTQLPPPPTEGTTSNSFFYSCNVYCGHNASTCTNLLPFSFSRYFLRYVNQSAEFFNDIDNFLCRFVSRFRPFVKFINKRQEFYKLTTAIFSCECGDNVLDVFPCFFSSKFYHVTPTFLRSLFV